MPLSLGVPQVRRVEVIAQTIQAGRISGQLQQRSPGKINLGGGGVRTGNFKYD